MSIGECLHVYMHYYVCGMFVCVRESVYNNLRMTNSVVEEAVFP